jgi:hypothetical protein
MMEALCTSEMLEISRTFAYFLALILEIAGGKRQGPGFGIIASGNYRYHAWYEFRNNSAGDMYNAF